MDPLSRRRLLQAGLAATFLPSLLSRRADAGTAAPPIHPRADWGGDLPPRGPLEAERPEDVRFLLVHHSVSVNDYPPEAVPEELRSFFRLHTAPEKGWADIAYNFLVDRFGGIWEGRAGSIEAPIKGDATGGSQGFAILCCFVGDHRTAAPSAEAQASMVALLAWLAGRYGIDPRPGAMTSFTSRGSNRWPAATPVTAPTIAGHRDMSETVCPGDAAYHLVRNDFPVRVAATLGIPAAPPPVSTTTSALSTPAASAPATAPTPAPSPTAVAAPPPTAQRASAPATRTTAAKPPAADEGRGLILRVSAAAAAGIGAAALVISRRLGSAG
ncbi:MAG: N-acetylmuramoyl-L-alanine amidase [Actinomycetota bacterium]|nr:N-acetylmuramoyl-L-alanine amidase [Actinomycetota bacterium]